LSLLPPQAALRPLDVGARVPDLGWRDARGRHVALELPAYAGRTSLVLACPAAAGSAVQRELAKLRDLHDKFARLGVQVFAVTPASPQENAALGDKLKLPFPLLSDVAFALGRALGLDPTAKKKASGCAVLLADPNQRIQKTLAAANDGRQGIRALAYCEKRATADSPGATSSQPGAESSVVANLAPVLILPNVISEAHCARLVGTWERGDRYAGGVANADYGRNVAIDKIKIREDVALADNGPEAHELFGVFRERLFPEIRKAFQFRVTRAETLRIGCYTAEAGGHFVPHRDDTTPYTAHRRFAMSLNLNAGDYEGGYLRFPEYGPQLYSVGTGGAVVFSCALLHEATRVTRGRRLVLLGFFYSEAEQALREKVHAQSKIKS
jgi:peroxiredoxin/predicted 2-oxoglutarate/Fe(II)-dependent dioxygenase YbiX